MASMASMASENNNIILNITEGTYFEYSQEYEETLKSLFSRYNNGGRWLNDDKIVFVPNKDNLKKYVKSKYEKVFP
jgi:hypothetical protein